MLRGPAAASWGPGRQWIAKFRLGYSVVQHNVLQARAVSCQIPGPDRAACAFKTDLTDQTHLVNVQKERWRLSKILLLGRILGKPLFDLGTTSRTAQGGSPRVAVASKAQVLPTILPPPGKAPD